MREIANCQLAVRSWSAGQQCEAVARLPSSADTTARVPRQQSPDCLLAFTGSLFRSRVEKTLAHLSRHIAGDGTLACPRECRVHIGGFQYPETAYVLLGLGVWPIGDEHRTIRLLPHRLCVSGRGNPARELPRAGSNQFTVERRVSSRPPLRLRRTGRSRQGGSWQPNIAACSLL